MVCVTVMQVPDIALIAEASVWKGDPLQRAISNIHIASQTTR